jgi:predicted RND superfamily exporter protein
MAEGTRTDSWTFKFAAWWIDHPVLTFVLMAVPTLVLASKIPTIEVYSRFADLLPQRHDYIVTYNEMRETFGGANVVTMSLEATEGDIYDHSTLEKVRFLTDEVDKVGGVNHYQVASIAHRKIRRIVTNASGMVKSQPVLPKFVPKDVAKLTQLREEMFNNDIVYGTYISEDGRAAMILAGFDEDRLDYNVIFTRLRELRWLVESDNFYVARALDGVHTTLRADIVDWSKAKSAWRKFGKELKTQEFAVDAGLLEPIPPAIDEGSVLAKARSAATRAAADAAGAADKAAGSADETATAAVLQAARLAEVEAQAAVDAKEAQVAALFAAVRDYVMIANGDAEGGAAIGRIPQTRLFIAGEPMLKGWIYYHSGQLKLIFTITGLLFAILLLLNFRSFPGLVLPILSTGISAVWGLGFVGWVGFNLDPLILVVPILISARTASHAVQFLERYRDEIRTGIDRKPAVVNTMGELLTPSLIAIFTDAAGLLVLAVSSIPIIAKLGIFCCFWSASNMISVPLMLPWFVAHLMAPRADVGHGVDADGVPEAFAQRSMFRLGRFLVSSASNVPVAIVVGVLVFGSLYFAKDVVVGENQPGSPILFGDSDYNVAAAAINARFAGSNQLSIYLVGEEEHAMKRPDVVSTVARVRAHMMAVPGSGGPRAVPTLVRSINRLYHFDDPRWSSMPEAQADIGNILFMYEAGAAIPGVILEYMNYPASTANFVVFFKDATGDTVRRAVDHAKDFIATHPLEGVKYELAGGYVGVTAAANEEIEHSELIQTALILLVVMASVLVTYRSFTAPALVFVVLVIAVLVNRAFMGIRGIGLNVNTLPVTAVGIGIGVDYAIYILDRIREEASHMPVEDAIVKALSTTGAAVVFTAVTVVAGILFWIVGSNLRFNSEMALLLTLLMGGHMIGAITVLPMMIRVFQPRFITGETGANEAARDAAAETAPRSA